MGMPEIPCGDSSKEKEAGSPPRTPRSKDSQEIIRKPPQPVIIHEDPEIIHVKPEDYKSVVQLLTGQASTCTSSTSATTSSPSTPAAIMHMPEIPSGDSSREKGEAPRAEPLNVSKDSHKIIKKARKPVIIHKPDPKIIHVKPEDFKSLVQRLTGQVSTAFATTSVPSTVDSSSDFHENSGGATPAQGFQDDGMGSRLEIESGLLPRTVPSPVGILSPDPNSLPSIPKYFSLPGSASYPLVFPNLNLTNYVDMNSFSTINPPTHSTLLPQQINMHSPDTLGDSNPNPWWTAPNFSLPLTDSDPLGFLPDHSPGLHTESINYSDNTSNTVINPTPSSSLLPQQLFNMHSSNTLDHLNPYCLQSFPWTFVPPLQDSNPLNFLPDNSIGLHSNSISYVNDSLNTSSPTPSTLFSPQINVPSLNTLDDFNTSLNCNRVDKFTGDQEKRKRTNEN